MIKGDISPNKFDEGELILVVDCDLLFSIKTKWKFPFFIKRTYILSDYNRKIRRLLNRLDGEFHRIIICIPKSNYYFEENTINKVLMLPYQVMNFENESTYRVWLNIIEPASHLATWKRRYYCKNVSKYIAPPEL